MIDKICDYIVSTVINETSDFQYCVFFEDIEYKFSIELTDVLISTLSSALEEREEIADVCIDSDGFDVVLYTKYAPKYQ